MGRKIDLDEDHVPQFYRYEPKPGLLVQSSGSEAGVIRKNNPM